MREEDIGKVFLFAIAWDWTWVGRLEGMIGDMLVLTEAGYFTRTGTTFENLCKDGFVAETEFHAVRTKDGRARISNNVNVLLSWEADWPQPQNRRRR